MSATGSTPSSGCASPIPSGSAFLRMDWPPVSSFHTAPALGAQMRFSLAGDPSSPRTPSVLPVMPGSTTTRSLLVMPTHLPSVRRSTPSRHNGGTSRSPLIRETVQPASGQRVWIWHSGSRPRRTRERPSWTSPTSSSDQHDEQRRMFAMLEEWPRDDHEGLAADLEAARDPPRDARRGRGAVLLPRAAARSARAAPTPSPSTRRSRTPSRTTTRSGTRSAEVGRCQTGSDEWWTAVVDANVAQQRPHGRGGAPGPRRLPPAREPRAAPRDRGAVPALRGA